MRYMTFIGCVFGTMLIFFVFALFVLSLFRLIHDYQHLPTESDLKPSNDVDILVLDPSVPFDAQKICDAQNVKNLPGTSILLAQNSSNDGVYIIDHTNNLIRMNV